MQEIVKKINEKLKSSGWYDELRIFLESSDFSDIITELKKKVDVDKQRFCPGLGSAFRFLEEVPVNDVKTVLLIDYATNRLDRASGIVISSASGEEDLQIAHLIKSTSDKVSNSSNWVKQGVLVIPLCLTSRIDGKPHKKLWTPLVMRLIEVINKKHPHIPWVLIGNDTWKYEEDLISNHVRRMDFKIPIEDKEWGQWINGVLSSQKKAEINW
jgi:uracil DNA glycosylase